MKTAILKIEVSDDFEKGQCTGCGLWDLISDLGYPLCKYGDCPLEIEDDEDVVKLHSDKCEECLHCGVFNDVGVCMKCNDYSNFTRR